MDYEAKADQWTLLAVVAVFVVAVVVVAAIAAAIIVDFTIAVIDAVVVPLCLALLQFWLYFSLWQLSHHHHQQQQRQQLITLSLFVLHEVFFEQFLLVAF